MRRRRQEREGRREDRGGGKGETGGRRKDRRGYWRRWEGMKGKEGMTKGYEKRRYKRVESLRD